MEQKRILNLDLIKIVAMVFVVGLHSGTKFYIGDIEVNYYYIFTICGTAIPLFFTVSGYLLLGRRNVDWHYSAKKIWGIVRFVFVVCWIYWLIMLIITLVPHWDKLYKDPLGAFLMGGTFWQFWYLGAMCIIYALYPTINRVYNERKDIFVSFFILIICVCAFVYLFNIFTSFEKKIPQSLRLWNWLMYFCLGGYIKMNPKNVQWKWVLLLAIAYCILFIIVKHINQPMGNSEYNFGSPITLLYIYCLFQALNHLNVQKIGYGIKCLSPLFLPVYTLHPFITPIRAHFRSIYPVYWMIITVLTIAISWIIMQTKVGKWVFRI